MDLIQKVKKTICRCKMFHAGDKVIVAVSGGGDSVFLIHALSTLRHELGINLHIAHLNHLLRKSADKDLRFVEVLAEKLNLPCTTAKMKIPKYKKKSSLEERARDIRLRFLVRTAKKYGADAIVLGHTKNDLAETVLMRILRGTGLQGMRGILPKRKIHGYS